MAALGVAFAAGVLASPAAADQTSALRITAQQLSQQIFREQLQVGGYQQQYQEQSALVAADEAAIAQVEQQLAADRRQVARGRRLLVQESLASLVDANVSPGDVALLFDTNQAQGITRSEFRQLIVGDVQTTVAQVRLAESALRAHQAALVAVQGQDRTAAQAAGSLLAQSQRTQGQLEAQQAQVTGQLAALMAQVQTVRATAAVRAAMGPPAPRGAASAPSPGGHATSDPPLNGYLQCVVMHESGGNYAAVSPGGTYMGAFQFSQATWNQAAVLAGLPGLVGVPPNAATKADQDTVAVALYALDGSRPWYDPCGTG